MTPQLIIALLQLGIAEGPTITAQILKIRGMLAQSPDVAANLKKIFDDTIQADDATVDLVNTWLKSKGFPELPTV